MRLYVSSQWGYITGCHWGHPFPVDCNPTSGQQLHLPVTVTETDILLVSIFQKDTWGDLQQLKEIYNNWRRYKTTEGDLQQLKEIYNNWRRSTTTAGDTRRYQEIPGDTRRYQEIAGYTRRYQEIPGDTRRYQEIPGVNSQEILEAPLHYTTGTGGALNLTLLIPQHNTRGHTYQTWTPTSTPITTTAWLRAWPP